jgi:hypothetical protein
MKRLMALALFAMTSSLLMAKTAEQAPLNAPAKHGAKKQSAAAATAPAAEVPEAPLTATELSIAERVHQGDMPCELGNTVRVEGDAQAPGYFNLHGKGFRFRMRPVATSTGAIRLEDGRAGAVWLQLGNKSMLMDQKLGRRIADQCASPAQIAVAEALKQAPAQSLLDGPVATKSGSDK